MSVSASVFDFCCETKLTQEYAHPSADPDAAPLDLEYKFPLGETDSAVVSFEALVGDRLLKGVVQEKAAALAAFNKARSAGHQALLLQNSSPAAPAEFSLKVGLLKGGQKLKITITYVSTLSLEGRSAARLVFPSAIAPKYAPNQYAGWKAPQGVAAAMGDAQEQGMDFMKQMMAAAMDPTPATASSSSSSSCPGVVVQQVQQPPLLEIKVTAMVPAGISAVSSPSHPQELECSIEAPIKAPNGTVYGRASAALKLDASYGGRASLQRDFVLLIHQDSFAPTRAVLEVDPATGDQALQLAFCPELFDAELDASSLQVEMLFLIDQRYTHTQLTRTQQKEKTG